MLTVIVLIVGGMKPWEDSAYFYSLVAIALSVMVVATVVGEFWRGGRVIARQTGVNICCRAWCVITRRNTRRYGGYLVHIGVVLIVIGFAGLPFNQDKEQEMGFGDKMQIGHYTLVCQSYTQDDKPNYGSEWAVMDVYKNGKKIDTMYPERRFYKASEQTSTMVANRSRPNEDLVPRVYGAQSGHGPADHQGARESAGDVDLDRRAHGADRHDHCAVPEHEAGEDVGEREGARRGGSGEERGGGRGRRLRQKSGTERTRFHSALAQDDTSPWERMRQIRDCTHCLGRCRGCDDVAAGAGCERRSIGDGHDWWPGVKDNSAGIRQVTGDGAIAVIY